MIDYDFLVERVKSSIVKQIQADLVKAAKNTDTSPTKKQIEDESYEKGELEIHGLTVAIENPKGSVRSGVDDNGKKWSNKIYHHYGDIKGFTGADGDDVDVFIGDDLSSENVFVINQINPATGDFDEHKVMLGFSTLESAKRGYLKNYDKGWGGIGSIEATTIDGLKAWLRTGKLKMPFTETKPK
jgi:hypothetical protein